MYHALTTLYQHKHTKIEMLPCDFKLFLGIFVGIMVMGFIIIPIIKHLCCIWPRYKNGIGCAKKPCCVYFHFWDNEGKVKVFWKGHKNSNKWEIWAFWKKKYSAQIVEVQNKNNICCTNKRTDVWSRDFMIWKINFGLWAVAWAGLWNKRVWADYEQLLRPVFSLFRVQIFFENISGSTIKSCIE